MDAAAPPDGEFARRISPWLNPPAATRQAWQDAKRQADKLKLKDIHDIVKEYDEGTLGVVAAKTKILTFLRLHDFVDTYVLKAKNVGPHPLNRAIQTDRIATLGADVYKAGFDPDSCSNAVAVQDVPGTSEIEHDRARRQPPAPPTHINKQVHWIGSVICRRCKHN